MATPALLPTYTPFPFTLVRGVGEYVYDEHDQPWLDAYGGHCVTSTGHCHPRVVAAIQEQAARLLFYSAAGDLPIRHQAAAALVEFAQGAGMASVFFCNSGAEANENALKIAHALTGRRRVLACSGGWHGRTLAALSVTDDAKLSRAQADWLLPVTRIPFNDRAALAEVPWSEFAAVIVEPIQSLAGVVTAEPLWLQELTERARRGGCLVILDEIQTGVGRLGVPWAAEHYGVRPDLITSAKGLASGVPIGAVLMREAIAAALGPGDLGSTFGGGPLACAALLATLGVIAAEDLMANVRTRSEELRRGLERLGYGVRGAGLLLGIEHPRAAALKPHLYAGRILVGGSADPAVLRLMPPLGLSAEAVARILARCADFPVRGMD